MTFSPEVEARFKRIEDAQLVSAELQSRAEQRMQEQIDRLDRIQDAMAKWMERMAVRQDEEEISTERMRQALADLAQTVDLYLKARSNGNN